MILAPLMTAALALAQAASAAPTTTAAEARLRACLDLARTDPAGAIATASEWAGEEAGAEVSLPQQCLGFAYVSLLRWEAAAEAFLIARDAREPEDRGARARLGAMAGNAALAAGDFEGAATVLTAAQADAEASGLDEVAGAAAADRARALVGAGRGAEAQEVLTGAQILAPQVADVWLLSAALARRNGDLRRAAELIATAAALAPADGEIGLEAGLIAALAGDDAAARRAWDAVVALDPAAPQAASARAYLAQLEEGAPPR